jgi:hypothetical protein
VMLGVTVTATIDSSSRTALGDGMRHESTAPTPSGPVFDVDKRLERRLVLVSTRSWLLVVAVALVIAAGVGWSILGRLPSTLQGSGALLPAGGLVAVTAAAGGMVTAVPALNDSDPSTQQVDLAADQPLVTITTATGASTVVSTPVAGTLVARAPFAVGTTIPAGFVVAQLVPASTQKSAVIFVDGGASPSIVPGMAVRMSVSTVSSAAYGDLLGTVSSVDALPYDAAELLQLAGGNADLARAMGAAGNIRVVVDLESADTPSGLAWSTASGPPHTLPAASLVTASIVLGDQQPMDHLLGS